MPGPVSGVIGQICEMSSNGQGRMTESHKYPGDRVSKADQIGISRVISPGPVCSDGDKHGS